MCKFCVDKVELVDYKDVNDIECSSEMPMHEATLLLSTLCRQHGILLGKETASQRNLRAFGSPEFPIPGLDDESGLGL